MKITKLLTPILGVSTLATTIAPIATSCTNNGHVWLSKIEKPAKTTNNQTVVYHFGLDNENYKNSEFNIKVISDNSNDFLVTWDISAKVLIVKVTYTKELTGEGIVPVDYKLRIQHINWSQEFDLTIKIDLTPTLDKYLERYDQIRATWLAHPTQPTTFDLAIGDYLTTDGDTYVVTNETEQANIYEGYTTDEPPYAISSFILDGQQKNYDSFEFNTHDEKKQLMEEEAATADEVKYVLYQDGSLGYYIRGTFSIQEGAAIMNLEQFTKLNKDGYPTELYLDRDITYTGGYKVHEIYNLHLSNFR